MGRGENDKVGVATKFEEKGKGRGNAKTEVPQERRASDDITTFCKIKAGSKNLVLKIKKIVVATFNFSFAKQQT